MQNNSTQNMTNYGELFCEAVDTIVKERLAHVSFDKTILCTIIDDTNRLQGLYIVSENDLKLFISSLGVKNER